MNRLPLAGSRILVTRAAHQAGKLSERLRALGAEPVEVPVLEIQPPAGYDAIDLALRRLDLVRLADFDERQYGASVCRAGRGIRRAAGTARSAQGRRNWRSNGGCCTQAGFAGHADSRRVCRRSNG